MNIHSIEIPGGFTGTVEVSEGTLKMEFSGASAMLDIKRYNFHLLNSDKRITNSICLGLRMENGVKIYDSDHSLL